MLPGVLTGARPAVIADDLGPPAEASRALDELAAIGADCDPHVGIVWFPGALEHCGRPQNKDVVVGWAKTWNELPECSLKETIFDALLEFLRSPRKGLALAPLLSKSRSEGVRSLSKLNSPGACNGQQADLSDSVDCDAL